MPKFGPLVDWKASGLLGAHVRRGAENNAESRSAGRDCRWIGRVVRKRRLERLGQTEVEDLRLAVACQRDIGRLEVTVHDAFLVCSLQGIGYLPRDRQRLGKGNCTSVSSDAPACRLRPVRGSRNRDPLTSSSP